MTFLLFAPASTKWLGWHKDRKSRRDPLGRFCDIHCAVCTMAFITAQNTWAHFWLSDTFFTSRGSNSPVSRVSRRKIYDVNLVHTSLRRKIYQRLFYGEKSIIVRCTLNVVLKSSNISRRHLYDVIIFSMTRYVVIITPTWNYDVNEEVRVTT